MKTLQELKRKGLSELEYYREILKHSHLLQQFEQQRNDIVIFKEVMKAMKELEEGQRLFDRGSLGRAKYLSSIDRKDNPWKTNDGDNKTYNGKLLTWTKWYCTMKGAKRIAYLRSKARPYVPLIVEFAKNLKPVKAGAISRWTKEEEYWYKRQKPSIFENKKICSIIYAIGEVGWNKKDEKVVLEFLEEALKFYFFFVNREVYARDTVAKVISKHLSKCLPIKQTIGNVCSEDRHTYENSTLMSIKFSLETNVKYK